MYYWSCEGFVNLTEIWYNWNISWMYMLFFFFTKKTIFFCFNGGTRDKMGNVTCTDYCKNSYNSEHQHLLSCLFGFFFQIKFFLLTWTQCYWRKVALKTKGMTLNLNKNNNKTRGKLVLQRDRKGGFFLNEFWIEKISKNTCLNMYFSNF